jgi:cytochrome P450
MGTTGHLQRSERGLPPAPPGHRLLGNLPDYTRDALGFMERIARDHGDVVPLRLGPVRALFLNNPQAIEEVLTTSHKRLRQSRAVGRLRTILGDGVFTSEGEEWLFQRRLMMPSFHRASVERYSDTIVARARNATERWSSAETVELVGEMRRLSLDVAVEALFGRGLDKAEGRMLGESVVAAGEHMQTRVNSMKMFIPDWLPTPGNRRTRAAVRRMNEVVQRIVDDRRSSAEEHVDLLSLLVHARDEEGGRMSDKQLGDAIRTLIIAGHDTTGSTLAWALYLLARHPQADSALEAELQDVLGNERQVVVDDLPRLAYLGKVVAETLRLYPAGFAAAREPLADMMVAGRTVPKGTVLLMSQWVRHRDPRVFEEPEAFRPERWTPDFEKSLRRADYFPFGIGQRQCIGQAFARLELMIALATLRQRYRFELVSDEVVRPTPRLALQPDRPITARLQPVH